jgi:hypothetical protein
MMMVGVLKAYHLRTMEDFLLCVIDSKKIQVKEYTSIVIKLQGDGKEYQFRIKSNSGDYYSYIAPFSTSGEWQEIVIPLKDMYPSFRGRKLNQPNFSKDSIEEITF